MPRGRTSVVLGALVATALACASSAAAQQPDEGLFSVTPARQSIAGQPPKNLIPVLVSNTTKRVLTVRVFAVLLTQEVSGSLSFTETPRALNVARLILTASPDRFDLKPGEGRSVAIRWNLVGRGQRVADMGVVFESHGLPEPAQPVASIQRLLTSEFLRLPGHYRITGELTQLRTEQGGPKVLNFIPRVKNTGDLVAVPSGTHFSIRDAQGGIVYRATWPGDIILPGAQRDFPITVKKVFPKGDYTATATGHFGTSRLRLSKDFTLVGPNELPTPRVALENFQGSGTIGGDSAVSVDLHSIGSATAETSLRFDLYRLKGAQRSAKPIFSEKHRYTGLAPGSTKKLRVVYRKLPEGDYLAIATYRETPELVKQVQVSFSPVKELSFWDRIKNFFRDHKILVLGILALLLLLLVILAFLRRQMKLKRELEEARRAGTEAEPATGPILAAPETPPAEAATTPPTGRRVNINTASLEELQAIPGVGPRAAQRLIDHRAEYGSFRSVDELAEVEGFGAKRVAQLRDAIDI